MSGATAVGEGTHVSGIQFGVYLPQLRMDVPTILERVRTAEAAGFSSAWLMDHLMAPMLPEADTYEAWTLISALAAGTERIRLGHLVGCDPFRHPALLAKMAVTVDAISGGRLELGLGWGSVEDELRRLGFGPAPADERAARLGETLEVLELLLTGEPVTFTGEHVRLEEVVCRPTPVTGRIPVHLGGAGERLTMPLVRRYADWWNCPAYGLDRLEDLCAQAGDARVSVQHPIGFVADGADREEVATTAERRFGGWGGLLVGDAAELAERLAAEAELGVELFILQFSDFGHPATLEAFGREVLPRLHVGDHA